MGDAVSGWWIWTRGRYRNLLLVAGFAAVLAAPAAARDVFVDSARGDDQRGDGSAARPWRTVTHAITLVRTRGDVIHLGAGRYDVAGGEAAELSLAEGVALVGAPLHRSVVAVPVKVADHGRAEGLMMESAGISVAIFFYPPSPPIPANPP